MHICCLIWSLLVEIIFSLFYKWRHREVKRKAHGSRAISSENKIYGELLRISVGFFVCFFVLHINMDTAYLKSQELQFWRHIGVPWKSVLGKRDWGVIRIKSHHCCLGTIVIDSDTSQNMSVLKKSQLFLGRGLISIFNLWQVLWMTSSDQKVRFHPGLKVHTSHFLNSLLAPFKSALLAILTPFWFSIHSSPNFSLLIEMYL